MFQPLEGHLQGEELILFSTVPHFLLRNKYNSLRWILQIVTHFVNLHCRYISTVLRENYPVRVETWELHKGLIVKWRFNNIWVHLSVFITIFEGYVAHVVQLMLPIHYLWYMITWLIVRGRVQKFPAWHTKAAPNGKCCEGYIAPAMVRLMYQFQAVTCSRMLEALMLVVVLFQSP
jgi:hypothetical protein